MTKSVNSSLAVLLYVPNIIGYSRVALMIASFYYAFTSWKITLICCKNWFFDSFLKLFDFQSYFCSLLFSILFYLSTLSKLLSFNLILLYSFIYTSMFLFLHSHVCWRFLSFSLLYTKDLLAFVGDVVDGYAARAFNQCEWLYFWFIK
jgi:phosphatidylglycerophosphate synthase